MLKIKKQTSIKVLELIWLFLGISAIIGVDLLFLKIFSPLLVIGLTLLSLVVIYFIFKPKFVLKDIRFDWIIIVILAFSLLIRLGPWIYLEGGQDQGVYVAMSKQYELNGQLNFKDNVYELLPEYLKEYYGKERGGWFALGFNRAADSTINTNFYPAHPVMLSIGGVLFGDENRVYMLTVFAVLSVLMAYLVAFELTGRRKVGYLSAILIAISPLHLYFSKFPVTEIMTLALNLGAIYYLLKAKNSGNYLYLLLNLLLVNVTLYTRLTWLISLPVYIFAIFSILAYEKDKKGYRVWMAYLVGIIISFLISVLFYYTQIPFLYKNFLRDIFDYIPSKVFYTLLIASPLIIYILTTYLKKYSQLVLEFLYKYRLVFFYLIIIALIYVSANAFYKMVFTDRYVGTRYDYFWGMARGGWVVLKDMALSSLIIYVTPFGLLGLLLAGHKIKSPQSFFLILLLLAYMFFHLFIVKYTPYHFYYARYQLSEIVPILLIFVAFVTVEFMDSKKWLAYLICVPIFIYSIIYIPFITLQGQVGITPNIFHKISEDVNKDDVIMYFNPHPNWSSNFLFSPLKYFYDFNAIKIENLDEAAMYGESLANTYILSTTQLYGENYKYVDKYKFEKGFFTNAKEDKPPLENKINDWKIPSCDLYIPEKFCGGAIPIKYHKASIDIYLYNYKTRN